LFQPLSQAYAQVVEIAHQQTGLPYPCARTFVAEHPQCFLPMVEAALDHLSAEEILEKRDNKAGFACGPQWHQRASFYRKPLLAPLVNKQN